MPLVIISRKSDVVSDGDVLYLSEILQDAVADVLDIEENPNARLTKDDVEVRVREPGPLDRNASNLAIEIIANDYPERRADLQRAAETIADIVRNNFEDLIEEGKLGENSFVWILLAPTGFAII